MSKRHVASATAVAQTDVGSADVADANSSSTSTIISKALKKNGKWDKGIYKYKHLIICMYVYIYYHTYR